MCYVLGGDKINLMTKVIGKSDKYYTLWEVWREHKTNSRGEGYEVIHCEYLQNLSYDLDNAKIKAPASEVDESLRGHRSFVSIKWDKPPEANDCFITGKYNGQKIKDCTDLQYIHWIFESNNLYIIPIQYREIAEAKLIQAGYKRINDSVILTPEDAKILNDKVDYIYSLKEKLDLGEDLILKFDHNLRSENIHDKIVGTYTFGDKNIQVIFPNIKEMYYNRIYYYIPIDSKEKAHKIKGKNILLKDCRYTLTPNEFGWAPMLVITCKDFVVLKG